jgi:protein-tyrosine phosphatase
MGRYNPHIDVLFVCTGNICRSPMAEAFLQRRLLEVAADAPDGRVRIHSAGTHATLGSPPPAVLAAAADFGVDLGNHRSRQLDAALLDEADLVIGMAREHVREAVLAGSGAFAKTFTLRELLRRAADTGGPRQAEPLGDWLAVVGAGRTAADLIGSSRTDDVSDPYGGPHSGYEASAVVIDDLISDLANLLRPVAPS